MKLSDIAIDVERSEGGDWVRDIPDAGELQLKVRGLRSKDYQQRIATQMAAVPRSKRVAGRIPADVSGRIIGEAMAEHLLLDWRGLTDDNDQPLPFSKEKARQLLVDPRYTRFREWVSWAAAEVEELGADAVEAPLGNS